MEYETSFIKCYGTQRRILLKKDGILQGCPENEHPLEVVIISKNTFDQVMEDREKLKTFEKDKKTLLDNYQHDLETLENDVKHLNERIDQLKQSHENEINLMQGTIKDLKDEKATLQKKKDNSESDLKTALAWIGLSWGVIQNLKNKNRWQVLIGGIDKAARELPEPAPALLPPNPKDIIQHEEKG